MRHRIRARSLVCALAVASMTSACHTPTRGEPCKHDDDGKKGGLECAQIAIGGNAGDCPEGWKCHDISNFSDVQDNVCVRK